MWFNVLKQDGQPYDWHTHNNTTGVYYLLNTENSGTIIDDYLDVCISQDISLNVSTKDTFKVNSVDNSLFFIRPNIKHKIPTDWKGKDRITIAMDFND